MPYLARRLFHSVFLLACVSLLTFALVDLAPGEFFDEMRLDPRVSKETIAGLRSHYGLDLPLPVKYLRWLESVLRGECGFSLSYNSPAGPIVWRRAQNTLLLTGTATFFAWLIAVPCGIWIAARSGRRIDLFAGATISVLLAIPDLVLGLLLLLLAVRTGYFPVGGEASLEFSRLDFWSKSKDLVQHLFLPGLCLTAGLLPLLLSHVRAALVETLDSPFIAAARGHGIPRRRLLLRHALPAAANPLISLFGLSLGMLLSSSLVIEGIFAWPGLGQLLIAAILQRDFYLIVDAVVLATVFLIFGNLTADALLYVTDPRIRTEQP
jgi:peptide/nickel transport system permease protein